MGMRCNADSTDALQFFHLCTHVALTLNILLHIPFLYRTFCRAEYSQSIGTLLFAYLRLRDHRRLFAVDDRKKLRGFGLAGIHS